MGLKISEMERLNFLKAGLDGIQESLEIAYSDGSPLPTTYKVSSYDLAGVAAPFRSIVNTEVTTSILDGFTFVGVRISLADILREQIRYDQQSPYDPTDPDTFPHFEILSASLRINLTFTFLEDEVDPFGWESISGELNYSQDAGFWSFRGIIGGGFYVESVPLPVDIGEYSYRSAVPTSVDYENNTGNFDEVLISFKAQPSSEISDLTMKTFGFVDGVFMLTPQD